MLRQGKVPHTHATKARRIALCILLEVSWWMHDLKVVGEVPEAVRGEEGKLRRAFSCLRRRFLRRFFRSTVGSAGAGSEGTGADEARRV